MTFCEPASIVFTASSEIHAFGGFFISAIQQTAYFGSVVSATHYAHNNFQGNNSRLTDTLTELASSKNSTEKIKV